MLPFPGNTTEAIFDSILNRTPERPSRINPDTPPQLGEIINKALEKDRDVRCPSAAELRADLNRLKRGMESRRHTSLASFAETPTVQKPGQHGLKMLNGFVMAAVLLAFGFGAF